MNRQIKHRAQTPHHTHVSKTTTTTAAATTTTTTTTMQMQHGCQEEILLEEEGDQSSYGDVVCSVRVEQTKERF